MVRSWFGARHAALAFVAVGVAGCAGGGLFGAEPPVPVVAQPPALQATTPGQVMVPTETATRFDCPMIEVRPGTEVLRFAPSGREAVPTDLVWQATITTSERECAEAGGRVGMRIGIEGMVLLGPQGRPGTFRLPVRVAVIKGDNTVLSSRVVPISVTIAPGETSASFAIVDEGTSLARAPDDRLTDVSVAVGFDPAPERPQRRRAARG